MNNKEYFKNLEKHTTHLCQLRKKGQDIAAGIIGKTLFQEDLFFSACIDRCLNLIDGIIILLKERNLTCAAPLLRLQMDNCMRCYASSIAKDPSSFFECIINGNPINQQLSKEGKKMSDGYLKDAISIFDSNFNTIYNNTSGFIHLSDKAFYQTVDECKDNHIFFHVGMPLPERRNKNLIEIAEAFIHYVNFLYSMLNSAIESKKQFDHANNNT